MDRVRLRRYRVIAASGGSAVGAVAGAILGGPGIHLWSHPVAWWLSYVGAGALAGVVIGYLFFEVVIASEAIGDGSGTSGRTGDPSHAGQGQAGGGGDEIDD